VLKLTITVFFSRYFQTFWPKWLNFFSHFKNVSVCDQKNPRFATALVFVKGQNEFCQNFWLLARSRCCPLVCSIFLLYNKNW